MIRPVPHVGAMAAYALADLGDAGTVSLAQNESAFAPSPRAIEAGKTSLDQATLYPDPDWGDLRVAISEVHGLNPKNILCGAGSMELIGGLIRAFSGPGDEVLGSRYGYAFAATATEQAQAGYVTAPEADLTVSVDNMLEAVTSNTKIVFLCNPGNPTGTLISNSEIVRLRQDLPRDVLLVVDQAYAEFADATNDPAEIFALAERGETVVTRTLSKAYGLAGTRVGWAVLPTEIADETRKLLNPNNISITSQAMAIAAITDQDHMRGIVRQTSAIRDGFADAARALGLTVPVSHTNFVLLRFGSPDMARQADRALRADKLLARGMGGYGLPDCLRVTICAQVVMDRVLSALKGVTR